jgi:hypothetical protein
MLFHAVDIRCEHPYDDGQEGAYQSMDDGEREARYLPALYLPPSSLHSLLCDTHLLANAVALVGTAREF